MYIGTFHTIKFCITICSNWQCTLKILHLRLNTLSWASSVPAKVCPTECCEEIFGAWSWGTHTGYNHASAKAVMQVMPVTCIMLPLQKAVSRMAKATLLLTVVRTPLVLDSMYIGIQWWYFAIVIDWICTMKSGSLVPVRPSSAKPGQSRHKIGIQHVEAWSLL